MCDSSQSASYTLLGIMIENTLRQRGKKVTDDNLESCKQDENLVEQLPFQRAFGQARSSLLRVVVWVNDGEGIGRRGLTW